MVRQRSLPEQEAERVFEAARSEFLSLGEPWDNYGIDVELIATLLYDLGVQRVPDLRVGDREYAAFLNGNARLIAVEEQHHPHRQRFSIAHEIGHFVLHHLPRPVRGLFACSASDMELSAAPGGHGAKALHLQQESEANLFARALLMPETSVRAMHKVTGGRVIPMSRHFKVSPQAMEIRLAQLGLPFSPLPR